MYCRNYAGTVSRVLCREVYYTVSLSGRFTIGGFTGPESLGDLQFGHKTVYVTGLNAGFTKGEVTSSTFNVYGDIMNTLYNHYGILICLPCVS